MSIADWFSARERRYTKLPEDAKSNDVPDGVWTKCDGCGKTLYEGELIESLRVCRHCGHHFPLSAPERLDMLVDEGTFAEMDSDLTSCDPLEFVAAKSYATSLAGARERSGLPEAVVSGTAAIEGSPVVIAIMDFRFIAASMGSVVGEKITRAFELATVRQLPIVVVSASGGARMQEGMLSLMQMAKTSAAAARHSAAGLPYIAVLTDPTYGGVTASFAVLGDVIVAEPGAMIGFAGPRLVEQTIRQKLPKGFQTAESMLKHGMIDEVVPRGELKDTLALLLGYLAPATVTRGGDRR